MVGVTITVSAVPLQTLVTTARGDSDKQLTTAANEAVNLLLSSTDMLEALTLLSAPLAPVRNTQILSSFWGLIATAGQRNISLQDVEKAVLTLGGSSYAAGALWQKLNLDGNLTITPGDIAQNPYLSAGLQLSRSAILEAVEQTRQQQAAVAASSASILDYFGGAGILDLFV